MIFSKLLISCCDWEKMNGIHLLEESQKCDKKNLVIEPNQLLWIYNTASRYVFIYNDHSISTLKIWKIPYKNLTNCYQKNHWIYNRISWLRSKLDGPLSAKMEDCSKSRRSWAKVNDPSESNSLSFISWGRGVSSQTSSFILGVHLLLNKTAHFYHLRACSWGSEFIHHTDIPVKMGNINAFDREFSPLAPSVRALELNSVFISNGCLALHEKLTDCFAFFDNFGNWISSFYFAFTFGPTSLIDDRPV